MAGARRKLRGCWFGTYTACAEDGRGWRRAAEELRRFHYLGGNAVFEMSHLRFVCSLFLFFFAGFSEAGACTSFVYGRHSQRVLQFSVPTQQPSNLENNNDKETTRNSENLKYVKNTTSMQQQAKYGK